jgi:hypothetical protein
MSEFYNRLADTALRLIAEKGTPCTITSASIQGGFDPSTGMPTDDLPSTVQQGQCVVLNYQESIYNAPESLVQVGDKKLLLSAKGVTIDRLNGTIEALGSIYTVISVKDLNPAGITLIYEVHGRI